MPIDNPYHEGELTVQRRADESEIARINGRAIDETILGGALRFIEQQAMVVVGSIDSVGQVWSSVLFGQPGFLRALDNRTLELDVSKQRSSIHDPLWRNLQNNPDVGLIVIELGSRRRIRINGVAEKISEDKYIIKVNHAYPNCPKYIQRRVLKVTDDKIENTTIKQGTGLTTEQKQLINSADTFFVASAHQEQGVDASHRGGHPGFVKIINDRLLQIPDFVGNSLFNTLGNFVSYPHAGAVFIDFDKNQLLQLTGVPEILWDKDDPNEETGGTQRYWQLHIDSWVESPLPVHVNWEYMDASFHIPELQVEEDNHLLQLKVERIQQESSLVKSFRLRSVNDRSLPEFEAGAHLQVKVILPDGSEAFRHYSILSSPNECSHYDIGVLKERNGRGGSLFMHEQVCEGDVVEFHSPKNEFPMISNAKHTILIAGGIGITPILSMLYALSESKQSYEMHYTARKFSGLAFRNRIEDIAADKAHFYASQDVKSEKLNLKRLLAEPEPAKQVYVCGPVRLINAAREVASASGWQDSQIHFESFGVKQNPDDGSFKVHLAREGKELLVPKDQSILDVLINAGVSVPHDCKRGECSLCATRVLEGAPVHRDLCLTAEEKKSSMCLCVSRTNDDYLRLDL